MMYNITTPIIIVLHRRPNRPPPNSRMQILLLSADFVVLYVFAWFKTSYNVHRNIAYICMLAAFVVLFWDQTPLELSNPPTVYHDCFKSEVF